MIAVNAMNPWRHVEMKAWASDRLKMLLRTSGGFPVQAFSTRPGIGCAIRTSSLACIHYAQGSTAAGVSLREGQFWKQQYQADGFNVTANQGTL